MIKKYRKYIIPKTIGDIATTSFLAVIIPTIYWYELWVILPDCHEIHSKLYYFHQIIGTFILFNVVSNMLAIMISDTSITGEMLQPPVDAKKQNWHLCTVCETLTPPRSWHCNICNICILKRDHHCTFTGYCIGHYNHRYFIWLITYLFIATTYAFCYNTYYLWILHGTEYISSLTFFKLIFPLALFLIDVSNQQLGLLIYLIGTIGMLFTGFLLYFHLRIVLRGSVVFDRKSNQYDLGLKRNIEMIFGNRWYLTWLSPFIYSKLPHDGINWNDVLTESSKNI